MLGVHQSPRLTLQTDPNASPPTPPRVRVAGDTLALSPNDWEAVGKVSPKRVTVAPFYMDATEVTTTVAPNATRAMIRPSQRKPPVRSLT